MSTALDVDPIADYLPLYDRRTAEMNDDAKTNEQFAELNRESATREVASMKTAQDKLAAFAPKAAKVIGTKIEEREQRILNQAAADVDAAGITWQKLVEFDKESDKLNKEQGYFVTLANDLPPEQDALKQRLVNLTGYQQRLYKRTLLRRAASTYKEDALDALQRKNDKGEYDISIKRDNLPSLTYGNATSKDDITALLSTYDVKYKYNEISWANSTFRSKYFTPEKERQTAAILTEFGKVRDANQTALRTEGHVDLLREASVTPTSLAEAINEINTTDHAWYARGPKGENYGAGGVKRHVVQLLAEEADKFNTTDGAEGIDPVLITNALDGVDGIGGKVFLVDHRGHKGLVPLSKFKEFNTGEGGLFQEKLAELGAKRVNTYNRKIQIIQGDIVKKVRQSIQENGPLNNFQQTQLIEQLTTNPEYRGIPIPEYILKLPTVETIDDVQTEKDNWAKINANIPLREEDYLYFTKAADREKWKGIYNSPRGQGMSVEAYNIRSQLQGVVQSANWSQVLPTQLQYSAGFQLQVKQAERLFSSYFQGHVNDYPEITDTPARQKKIAEDAFTYVKERIMNEDLGEQDLTIDFKTSTSKLKEDQLGAMNWLGDNQESGINATEALSNELIPGSEIHYKALEKWAKQPTLYKFPNYYYMIAANIPGKSAFDIANLQYKSQTGKDLPKPPSIKKVESMRPIIRYFHSHKPNGQKLNRGNLMENNNNFDENNLTPGLIQEPDPFTEELVV